MCVSVWVCFCVWGCLWEYILRIASHVSHQMMIALFLSRNDNNFVVHRTLRMCCVPSAPIHGLIGKQFLFFVNSVCRSNTLGNSARILPPPITNNNHITEFSIRGISILISAYCFHNIISNMRTNYRTAKNMKEKEEEQTHSDSM